LKARWRAGSAIVAAAAIGCGSDAAVIRVYDGRIVPGAYVPPNAYAAYLKGVLAEEQGDLRSALAAYERAASDDDEDPEPFTRIGDVRCRLDPRSNAADEAFGRAARLDPTYAPALAARARCAAMRGDPAAGIRLVEQVAPPDRTSPTIEAVFVRLAAQRGEAASADAAARQRAIALTLGHAEQPVAWDALVAWSRAKGDTELLAAAFEGLLRAAPIRSREVEAGALELLGAGQSSLARRVAAAVADSGPERGIASLHDATVARLAVDEALLRGDRERAERRATRGHVPAGELAARALILERADVAGAIAEAVLSADPAAGCAAMVVAAIHARDGSPPAPAERPPAPASTDRPAAACVLALAERLAVVADPEAARRWAARVTPAPMAPHDPIVGPLAVDLAARGVVAETALPLELRLELAARRREAPPPVSTTADLDARHVLLWHTLVDPSGAPASALLARLYRAADRDPIVGFSLARAALAGPAAPADRWASVVRAIAAAPSHPLLLAAAVDLAKRAGRAEDAEPARVRLMAVARTPAERALARE
jgi:hypothetical protein